MDSLNRGPEGSYSFQGSKRLPDDIRPEAHAVDDVPIPLEIDDRDRRTGLLKLLELDHEELQVRALLTSFSDPFDFCDREPVEPIDGRQLARLVHFRQFGQPTERY